MAVVKEKVYNAYAYFRLSKEDGDKAESNSIANQRALIEEFVSKQDNIKLVGEQFDDGYTGINFDRPGFQKMIEALENGEANCVIVKDLSRLGRDYIGTGKFIQNFFPALDIRFIAINDGVDSTRKSHSDELLIPFKNLMNDTYCRDLSNKLRYQLKVQRKKGEFMGSYVFYGYKKDKEDKHKIVPDEVAAQVVKEIFNLYLQGYSKINIAKKLNESGVPSPLQYKNKQGINIKSGFCADGEGSWGHKTIDRILTNRIYIGVLEQYKRSTPNYKVKIMKNIDPADWIVVEDNHEPIIEKAVFEATARMLKRDVKSSHSTGKTYPLSGLLYCADCGSTMHYKVVKASGKQFAYYVCKTYNIGKGCSNHSFTVENMHQIVLNAINKQIEITVELQNMANEVGKAKLQTSKLQKLVYLIENKEKEIEEKKTYRMHLYESMVNEIITHDDYVENRVMYTNIILELEEQLNVLKNELESVQNGLYGDNSWMDLFVSKGKVTEITRDVAVMLIDVIKVHEDKSLEIIFNYKNEFNELMNFVKTFSEVG